MSSPIRFPRDAGRHRNPIYEYWYYNGSFHAVDDPAKEYGFYFYVRPYRGKELKRALELVHYYMTRASVTVVDPAAGGRYLTGESVGSFSKGKADFGARHASRNTTQRMSTVLSKGPASRQPHPWRVQYTGPHHTLECDYPDFGLSLTLEQQKPPALIHGTGVFEVRNGGDLNQYDVTRLALQGNLRLDGQALRVAGNAWFQHTWINQQPVSMFSNRARWRWMNFHLDDGTDLCSGHAFDVKTGETTAVFAHLTGMDGKVTEIIPDVKVLSTRGQYEASWNIRAPEIGLNVDVVPVMPDQEMRSAESGQVHFEGYCHIEGASRGQKVHGSGYVELVGYA